jgi:nicotinamidase-related amidase
MDPLPVPGKGILLIMDFQPVILRRVSDAPELLSRVSDVIDSVRRRGFAVGYVRVAFEDADYLRIPPTNKALTALTSGRAMHAASPDSAIHQAVAPRPGDIIVRKTRVGAFSTTDLHSQLQSRAIDTLILAGISTSGVVLSTIRDAADRDYRIIVLSDCCRDTDPEVHEDLTTKIFPRQAAVMLSTDIFPPVAGSPGEAE